jgi:hypothetical protein
MYLIVLLTKKSTFFCYKGDVRDGFRSSQSKVQLSFTMLQDTGPLLVVELIMRVGGSSLEHNVNLDSTLLDA